MQRFFPDFESLDRFTLSLDCHAPPCPHCANREQLVSHGVIYKQRAMNEREAVGKRVFCSNRHPHAGCGRTVQLYVAVVLPGLRYGAAQWFVFLSTLLLGMAVEAAYRQATGQQDARHAWRWLQRLADKLVDFRGCLPARVANVTTGFHTRVRRLRLVLSTLTQLFARFQDCPCAGYQLDQQTAFV